MTPEWATFHVSVQTSTKPIDAEFVTDREAVRAAVRGRLCLLPQEQTVALMRNLPKHPGDSHSMTWHYITVRVKRVA